MAGDYRKRLGKVLSYRRARQVTVAVAVLYFLLYLWLIGDITYEPGLAASAPSFEIVRDWPSKVFRYKVAFNYESIATLYPVSSLAILLSPMNILLGTVLSVLIGLNVGFLVYALKKPKVCGVTSKGGIAASVPGLFLGFACCAPTVLLAFGSAASSLFFGFIAVRSFFYPLAFLGLLASLWINLRRMDLSKD